jgi:hypothetical protein
VRDTAISVLEDELWLIAEQGQFTADECERLVRGELVTVKLHDTTVLLGVAWPRFADSSPVLVLDKQYPDDGILAPEEGVVAVEVRISCLAAVAYELLGLTLRQEVPGHEVRRIPLRACNNGRHDVWTTSLSAALAAGARMLHQATGGLVVDALAERNPPTILADFPPTEMPEPEDGFANINEEVMP